MRRSRGKRGVVLVVVLFFALLLTSSIATFLKRSTVDYMVARHRDDSAQAESLARGGIQIAIALVLDDKLQKSLPVHTGRERWGAAGNAEIPVGNGATLKLQIQDTGSKLNLNSLYDVENGVETGQLAPQALPFLNALLDKTVKEMGLTPEEEALYEKRIPELAENLADYLDADSERLRGGREDDFYQSQDPPYGAANGRILSVEELRLVEGFDAPLVAAISDYVTVYPYLGGGGINPNTAPNHVLALLYASDGGGEEELAREDTVKQILDVREKDGILCPDEVNGEECTPIREIIGNPIFPPPNYESNTFIVHATATVGQIERTVEAVIDVTQPTTPLLLSWHLR